MADNKTISEQFGEQLDLIHEVEQLRNRIEKEKSLSNRLAKELEDAKRQMAGIKESLQTEEEKRLNAEAKCREGEQKRQETERKYREGEQKLREAEQKRLEAEQEAEQIRAASGTGKKKRKGRWLWKLLKIVFVLILLGAVIYYYEGELDRKDNRNEMLWDEKEAYREKAEFMDDYVVIITDDIYHKYGCEELDLDNFAVRTTAAVEVRGWYTPCPVCIGEE